MKAALRIIIFVIVMGTVSGTMLVGLSKITEPQIKKNEELKLQSSMLDALEVPYGSKEAVLELFKQSVEVLQKDKYAFYRGTDGAVAFKFEGPGLWGPIRGIASINSDLKTIRTIKILHQEETPGLGARIAEKEYLGQFKNKEVIPRLIFTAQGKAKANNEVDAITGATGTSKALEKLLNESIEKNLSLLKS